MENGMFRSEIGSGFQESGGMCATENSEQYSHLTREGGTDHIIIPLSSICKSCELLEGVYGIVFSIRKLPFYKKITEFDSLGIKFWPKPP